MSRFRTRWLLPPALAASALLVAAIREYEGPASPAQSLNAWDIPRLTAYLNGEGLGLRLVATRQNGVIDNTAFLTTTAKEFEDLNRLPKDPKRIGWWQGTLYCERGPADDWSDLAWQWGDSSLIAGPFLFFGDPDLLARVRDALGKVAGRGFRVGSWLP
jgi:hypothetical protein